MPTPPDSPDRSALSVTAGWEPADLPVGQDGAIAPGSFALGGGGDAPPAFDEATTPCLRGPCRYYFQTSSHFDHGNAPGSLAVQPREYSRQCTAAPGVYLELTADAPILSCSRWDPVDPGDQAALEERRRRYYQGAAPIASPGDLDQEIAPEPVEPQAPALPRAEFILSRLPLEHPVGDEGIDYASFPPNQPFIWQADLLPQSWAGVSGQGVTPWQALADLGRQLQA